MATEPPGLRAGLRAGLRPGLRRRGVAATAGVAALAVVVWLEVEAHAAGLDEAANGVLATSSGANDTVTQARLDQLFGELRALQPVRTGLAMGAILAVLLAAGMIVAAVRASRGHRLAPPVRGAAWALLGVGVLALGGSAAALATSVAAFQRLQTPATAYGARDDVPLALASSSAVAGLLAAGLLALGAAVLAPAVAGRSVRRRVGATILLAVVLVAAGALLDVVGDDQGRSALFSALGISVGGLGEGAFEVVDQAASVIGDAPAIAAGLLVVAAVAVAGLAGRRVTVPRIAAVTRPAGD